jgi:hypothetical protein
MFLWNLPEKIIPSLFIEEIVSAGRWLEVFSKDFLEVHL